MSSVKLGWDFGFARCLQDFPSNSDIDLFITACGHANKPIILMTHFAGTSRNCKIEGALYCIEVDFLHPHRSWKFSFLL